MDNTSGNAGGEVKQEVKATTAVIQVKPEADPELVSFYGEAVKLQEYAEARTIASVEDIKSATNDLSIIANIKKAMEGKRKAYLTPIQDHVKSINETFKTLMAPIEQANTTTRSKIMAFNAEQERIRREQEAINRMKQETADREAKLKGEETKPVEVAPAIAAPPKRIDAEMGALGQRTIRKWELVDIALVPDEYKILDSAKVTKVVKAGVPSIPGIRIYEEPVLVVRPS